MRPGERLFFDHFQDTGRPVTVYRAPGRVNVIGEHIDYNDGYVLPVAIDRHITMAVRPRDDETVALYSVNYKKEKTFPLGDSARDEDDFWVNYPKGVVNILLGEKQALTGFDAVVEGNVPMGGGLSSSAAFEVAAISALNDAFGLGLDPLTMIRWAKRAENEFVGVQCGIMDQFVSTLGKAGNAILIDCMTHEYEYVPFQTGPYEMIVIDTRKKHSLATSEYNTRRGECDAGLEELKGRIPGLTSYRDLTLGDFERNASHLEEKVRKRVRHIVTEIARVRQAVERLKAGDFEGIGDAINGSHDSLRGDYEVSCEELDFLVDTLRGYPGTLGARLTGAGFGGCMIAFVPRERAGEYSRQIEAAYRERFGIDPAVYLFKISDGAHRVD